MKSAQNKRRKRVHPVIRVGDTIQVMAGKRKGLIAKVQAIDWKHLQIVVEGGNIIHRHIRPSAKNNKGGIFDSEAPIHYSNVQLYSSVIGRGVRIRLESNEGMVKRRICIKTSNVIES